MQKHEKQFQVNSFKELKNKKKNSPESWLWIHFVFVHLTIWKLETFHEKREIKLENMKKTLGVDWLVDLNGEGNSNCELLEMKWETWVDSLVRWI